MHIVLADIRQEEELHLIMQISNRKLIIIIFGYLKFSPVDIDDDRPWNRKENDFFS